MQIERLREKSRQLVLTSAGHFVNDGMTYLVPLVAGILASERGLSAFPGVTAVLIGYYSSSTLLSLYVGRVADRTGKLGSLIGAGLALVAVGLIGFYLCLVYVKGTLLLLAAIASALISGFGGAFYHPLGAAVLQTVYGDKVRGRALGINGSVGSLGRAIYPSLFFVLALFLPNYGPFILFSLVGLVVAMVIWLGLPTASSHQSILVRDVARPRFLDALVSGIAVLTLIAFIRSFTMSAVIAWIPTYLAIRKGLGVTAALGISLTAMYGAAVVGQPIFGFLVDKMKSRALVMSMVGSGLSVLAYLYASPVIGLLFLSLFGLFNFNGFPVLLGLASQYAPRELSSQGNAWIWGIGISGGTAIGPLIIGAIVLNDYARLDLAFELMSVICILGTTAIMLLPKGTVTRIRSITP